MLEKLRRVEAEEILASGQHVDGRIGEELEEVLKEVEDDGSHDFEAEKLIVDEQFDERKRDQRNQRAFACVWRGRKEMSDQRAFNPAFGEKERKRAIR